MSSVLLEVGFLIFLLPLLPNIKPQSYLEVLSMPLKDKVLFVILILGIQ